MAIGHNIEARFGQHQMSRRAQNWSSVRSVFKMADFLALHTVHSPEAVAFLRTTEIGVIAAQLALDSIPDVEPGIRYSMLEVYTVRVLGNASRKASETSRQAQARMQQAYSISKDDLELAEEIVAFAFQEQPDIWERVLPIIPHYMGLATQVKERREHFYADRIRGMFLQTRGNLHRDQIARELGVPMGSVDRHLNLARAMYPEVVGSLQTGHPPGMTEESRRIVDQFWVILPKLEEEYGPYRYGNLTLETIAQRLGVQRDKLATLIGRYGPELGIPSHDRAATSQAVRKDIVAMLSEGSSVHEIIAAMNGRMISERLARQIINDLST